MGYFEIKETTSTDQYGVAHINKRAMVTGKGQIYLLNKMLTLEAA
ncbi:phage antirepressor KilAC domain-containing protein [Selenomonas ruminantium]|nr:phage antirepressor KilAC domain-containing protein [Selenomonas ruminantium]